MRFAAAMTLALSSPFAFAQSNATTARAKSSFQSSVALPRSLAADGALTDPKAEELAAFLQRLPKRTPEQVRESLQTLPGFRVDLVAAEPLVCSPVAGAFDEDGNLYIAEMIDYPYNRDQPVKISRQNLANPDSRILSRVRLLRDRDGDGRFDESHVFAEDLLWAAGVAPWKGGVFIAAPPDIWYRKDTDGDGKADVRRKVFTGFGVANQQSSVNSLILGLDHQIYGSTGANGGEIRPGANPGAEPVSLKRRDFRFDPNTEKLEPISGTQQFGLTFDDWGNRFLCNQNHPCAHVVLPLHYLERNPHTTPDAVFHHTTPLPTPLHRISPIERWRHIKSSRRLAAPGADPGASGISHHVIDAAAGITVYRGGAYPDSYYGNVFVGDSVANLIHRRVLVPAGATFRSERVDEGTEFVRSADPWFRPVNFINAPDGTLYCLDMAREYSESVNIPADVQANLDLTSGRDLGCIYRIAPTNFKVPPPPRLSRASDAELVAALESPHGWWRETAHRLLFERQAKSVVPQLRRLAIASGLAQARVHALWTLQGFDLLDSDTLGAALGDAHPGVRENAIRLAEAWLDRSDSLREKIASLWNDPHARVRLQVAFTVGESKQWDQATLLAKLALANLNDTWIQSAVLSSASQCSAQLFTKIRDNARAANNPAAVSFLRRLLISIGAQGDPAELDQIANTLATMESLGDSLQLLGGLVEGVKRRKASSSALSRTPALRRLMERAGIAAADVRQPIGIRESAVGSLALSNDERTLTLLVNLVERTQPEKIQLAALQALRLQRDPAIGDKLLQQVPQVSDRARTFIIDQAIERRDHHEALFAAVDDGVVRGSDFSAAQLELLRRHRDPEVRARALRLLGVSNQASRAETYEQLRPALELRGNTARGRTIFENRCAACHQHAGLGHDLGPNLATVHSAERANLLASIIDPNREVLPQYLTYIVETNSGETVAGILESETAASVTVRQPGAAKRTLARADIATLKPQDRSFMPEGLEAGLTPQEIADLLEFILHPNP